MTLTVLSDPFAVSPGTDMATLNSNSRFTVKHNAGTPDDPNLVGVDAIALALTDSASVSMVASRLVSTSASGALDSVPVSTADSKGVSSGLRASVSDSKALSNSIPTSVADSKALSVSVNTSIADSKAVSVQNSVPILTVVANSQNVSTAQSKAESAAAVGAAADSKALSGGTQATAADSKAVSIVAAVPAGTRTTTTLPSYLDHNAVFNVKDYGAVADGTASTGTEFSTAFNLAYAAALVAGGVVKIPPGSYYHNAAISQDHTNKFVKVKVEAHGAEIFSGTGVTGSAFKFSSAPQPHGLVIEGLKINHRNNASAAAAIEFSGMSHSVIRDVTLECHNTKANYAGILLSATTPGDGNTQCFWTTIDNFRVRQRGSDGTLAAYGIWLKGEANATRILGGSLSHCTKAIALTNDGVSTGMANGVVIDGVAIEGGPVVTGVDIIQTPGELWPTGLRVCNCRVESTTTFFSMTTGGAVGLNHSFPPFLYGNYVTNGSVTTYINNPTNAYICCLDMQSTGAATAAFRLQTNDNMRLVTSNGKNLILANESGLSTYSTVHLQLGEDGTGASLHLWPDTGTGNLRYKFGSAPSSATDGFMVAANGGQYTVAGLTVTASTGKIIPGSTSLAIRNNADSANNLLVSDAGLVTARAGVSIASGPLDHDGTTVGLYGATPVTRAAAITAPTAPSAGYVQAEATSMKTAVDAIRVALQNIGITL